MRMLSVDMLHAWAMPTHVLHEGSMPCTGLKPRVQSPRPSTVTTEQPSSDATGARQALMHLVFTASARCCSACRLF